METTDTNTVRMEYTGEAFRERMKERIGRVRRLVSGAPAEKTKVTEFRAPVKELQNN